MNRPLDIWLQRISVGALVLLAAALLTVGAVLYAPPPPSFPVAEVNR